jgi:hypothetical protein
MEEVKKQGMESLFCPYEQALALKELGFNEECLAYYNLQLQIEFKSCYNKVPIIMSGKKCGIPTFSQAFRWFRKEHNLKSFIQPIPDDVDTYIFAYGTKEIEHDDLDYLTHEEAEIACLIKLIEIVENEKML